MDFYAFVAREAGVEPLLPKLNQGVYCARRVGDGGDFLFVFNALPRENAVCLPPCSNVRTGAALAGETPLAPYETLVLCR